MPGDLQRAQQCAGCNGEDNLQPLHICTPHPEGSPELLSTRDDLARAVSGSLRVPAPPFLSGGWRSLGKTLGNHWRDNSSLQRIAIGAGRI